MTASGPVTLIAFRFAVNVSLSSPSFGEFKARCSPRARFRSWPEAAGNDVRSDVCFAGLTGNVSNRANPSFVTPIRHRIRARLIDTAPHSAPYGNLTLAGASGLSIRPKIAASRLYGPAPAETTKISMNAYSVSGR